MVRFIKKSYMSNSSRIINPEKLIQNIIDMQESLIFVFSELTLLMMNQSAETFFGVKNVTAYNESYGPFEDNFVPHPAYFNKEKVLDNKTWLETLDLLGENEKIVSMLNSEFEPRAFSVTVDSSHEAYTLLVLNDISVNLIKRIMIENEMNIDKSSGAFNKDYFLHTADSVRDSALFNKKKIGLTLIKSTCTKEIKVYSDKELLPIVAKHIKANIRQDGILVRWSERILVLIFLVDEASQALHYSHNLQTAVKEDLSIELDVKVAVSLVKENEHFDETIERISAYLKDFSLNEIRLLD